MDMCLDKLKKIREKYEWHSKLEPCKCDGCYLVDVIDMYQEKHREYILLLLDQTSLCADVITLRLQNKKLREHLGKMSSALIAIQQWDCLNPPQTDLCSDFLWLNQLVDTTLAEIKKDVDEENK